jgi:hypothetical protein
MVSPFAREMMRLEPGKYGYRGVRRHVGTWRQKPFYARVKFNNKEFYTKAYATARQAAVAYDDLARTLHKEKAILNFP